MKTFAKQYFYVRKANNREKNTESFAIYIIQLCFTILVQVIDFIFCFSLL